MPNSENETIQVVTLQEAKDYCGADIEDEANDRIFNNLIEVANQYLIGAIGKNYPREDARAKQLALALINEFYQNEENSQKVTSTIQKMISSFELQLKMELRMSEKNGET